MNDKLLDEAAKAYYEGKPFLTDTEFDNLAETQKYEKVGYNPDARVEHMFPLYSLQKVFEGEGTAPDLGGQVIETTKLDGAAIAIQYKGGKLYKVITRGDGKAGVDITDKFMSPDSIIPLNLSCWDDLQVTGEIVAPKEISNARNYAAGALNLKDVNEFSKRELTFIAYNAQPASTTTYINDMYILEAAGFNTVTNGDWSMFPEDGKVFRVNYNPRFEELGFTSHHPRGAYALKTREEGVITTLLDVVWQTGKSGKVTPVAILDPINIDDANISRATLNNMAYIEGLDLEIGCRVEVIRSGKIIPMIVKRV
jgi:DNA ligase (NAD+)